MGLATEQYTNVVTGTITMEWRETKTQRQAVLDHVTAFLNSESYPKSGSVDQKLTAINNYIALTFDYDSTLLNASAYQMINPASFSYKKGICTAYPLYAYTMLTAAGFTVRTVAPRLDFNAVMATPYAYAGAYAGAQKGSPAWIMIQTGGYWYHIDFTWDDPVGKTVARKTYFMKTDALMLYTGAAATSTAPKDHTWAMTYPEATPYYPVAEVTWAMPTSTPAPAATKGPTPTPKPTATPTPKTTPAASGTPAPTSATTPEETPSPSPEVTTDPNTTPTTAPPEPANPTATPTAAPTTAPTVTAAPTQPAPTPNGSSIAQKTVDLVQSTWNSAFHDGQPLSIAILAVVGVVLLFVLFLILRAISTRGKRRSQSALGARFQLQSFCYRNLI